MKKRYFQISFNNLFYFFSFIFLESWECILPVVKRCVDPPCDGNKSPLQTAALPAAGSVLRRSQTAIRLTHILAFCVYTQDDDVCKQWGKKSHSSALRAQRGLRLLRHRGRAGGRGRSPGPARGPLLSLSAVRRWVKPTCSHVSPQTCHYPPCPQLDGLWGCQRPRSTRI